MPDQDWFEWGIPRGWHGAAAQVEHEAGPDVDRCADAIIKAMAADLRTAGGVPELPAIIDAICSGGSFPNGLEERQFDAALISEARRLHADAGAAEMTEGEVLNRVVFSWAAAACEEHLFSRMRGGLVGKVFDGYDDVKAFEEQVLDRLQVTALGERLLRDPRALGLRAPNRRIRRAGTSALLGQDVALV